MSKQILKKFKLSLITCLLVAIAVLSGCSKSRTDRDTLVIINQSVSPGEIVYLKINVQDSINIKELNVTINDKAALVTGMKDDLVQVMVPNLEPGKAKVKVVTREKKTLEAELNILQSISKDLFLSMKDQKITYVKSTSSNNRFVQINDAGNDRRLSYDIFSEKMELLVRGTAVYPGTGIEYFDPDGKIRRTDYLPSGDFVLNIPNIPGALVIKFYEADEKSDLSTEKGLLARKLINEITIKN